MEPKDCEDNSTENAKISDSGYSNSQSHTISSGSSLSRDSNRSTNSGYHGGNPSTLEPPTEPLPKPISKRKDKGYKKKSKDASASVTAVEAAQNSTAVATVPVPIDNSHMALVMEPCKPTLDKAADEVAIVESMDATDPGVSNDNTLTAGPDAGLTSKTSVIDETCLQATDKCYAVISLHDGLVLQITPSLYASLGYPKDSWTGKLFIDLFDSRDKNILSERITKEIAVTRDFQPSGQKANIFCRLRKSNGHVLPYRINIVVQNFHGDKLSLSRSEVMLLVVFFQPVVSAFKAPEERMISSIFTTRHTASCRFSYVDPEVTQFLGYLPQDMIDRSIFDFYFPEDMPYIKEIYQTVINRDSSFCKPKPYRYIIQNGDFIVLETEWSTFINPWTKSLEFVTGQHRVLRGPADPNIFSPIDNHRTKPSNEILLKEAKKVENEIRTILIEGIQRKPLNAAVDCDLLSKSQELTSFVENILQEIKSSAPIKDQMEVDARSFSEHASVMLGEISPHHEYNGSKSSTETPPSYNQLNYHDNIERFFNSNLGASINNRPYGSDEENQNFCTNSSDETGKNNTSRPNNQKLESISSTNESGNSGSAENLSSNSNNQQSSDSRDETSNGISNNSSANGRVKPVPLTESVLNRHNEDMEKLLVQKHRQQKKDDNRNKAAIKDTKAKAIEQPACRGNVSTNKNGTKLKRNGSEIQGPNNSKMSKNMVEPEFLQSTGQPLATVNPTIKITSSDNPVNMAKNSPSVSLWPSAPTAIPSVTRLSHQCLAMENPCPQPLPRFSAYAQVYPVYYVPVPRDNPPQRCIPQERPGPPNPIGSYCFVPVPCISPAMYQPIIAPHAPATMMHRPFIVPEAATRVNVLPHQPTGPTVTAPQPTKTTTDNSVVNNCPASRPNSIQAEPGSTMAMSESSKKIFSPFGVVSSCISNEGGCFSVVDECATKNTTGNHYSEEKIDDSRYSSFFSSSINKSCCSSDTDQQQTSSSFESMKPQYIETRKRIKMVQKEPPWMKGINRTSDYYNYHISPKPLNDVLKADLEFLKNSKQPSLVNEQLKQLCLDHKLEGIDSLLVFEDPNSNTRSSDTSDWYIDKYLILFDEIAW